MLAVVILISLLAALTAGLTIRAQYRDKQWQEYVFKPVTTLLIIGLAVVGAVWNGDGTFHSAYPWLIIGGLVLCLGGDVFLMLPDRYFLPGLVSFLAGHWVYFAAFSVGVGIALSWWLAPLVVFGVMAYGLLHGHLGQMRAPVIFYMLTILVMAGQALGRWSELETTGALLAAAGAMLFVTSDFALALNRFRPAYAAAPLVVLGTYWAAQWLIALSLLA